MKKGFLKKLSCILVGAIAMSCAFFSVACGGEGQRKEKESYESKWIDGIDALFDESMGYSNENPSAFQEGATRYLYYTRNSEKYSEKTDVAVRKGTFSGGEWTYGEQKICITPSENGWDSQHVFGADVVKGSFAYRGENYAYLMAYSGNKLEKGKKDASIGLAVSKTPDGEWVKVGNEPFIAFSSAEWDTTGLIFYPGAIEPSLVSYDQGGKLWLFYEESEAFKSNYVIEMDASNLDDIKIGGKKVVETSGVSDLGISNPLLYGGDFVWDKDAGEFVAVRETTVTVTIDPKTSDELQVLRASDDVLYEHKQGWTGREEFVNEWWSTIGSKIDCDSTAVDGTDKDGYTRLNSPSIVSDPYGRLLNYGEIEVLFNSMGISGDPRAEREDAYAFTGMIHSYTITY